MRIFDGKLRINLLLLPWDHALRTRFLATSYARQRSIALCSLLNNTIGRNSVAISERDQRVRLKSLNLFPIFEIINTN